MEVEGNLKDLFQASLHTGRRRSWTRLGMINQGSVIYARNSLQFISNSFQRSLTGSMIHKTFISTFSNRIIF